MKLHHKILWSEGMFLQPQHFQQQERYIESLISQYFHLSYPWSWGITALKLEEHLLPSGKISLAHCRGIFPDGTLFDIPGRDKAPLPLDIPTESRDCIVYLALPLYRAGTADIADHNTSLTFARYTVETSDLDDSNTSDKISVPIQLATLSLRLMLETEDRSGYACLGLLRITEARHDHQLYLDQDFIPPALLLEASSRLTALVHDIQGLLHYRGNRLAELITEASAGGVSEIADFLLLQLINRYELLFQHLQQHLQKHPHLFYELLLQLTGELSTFTRTQRRPALQTTYLHHDLETTFTPLIFELHRALSMVLEESAVALPLENQSQGLWVAAHFDRQLLKTSLFILAIYAHLPAETIRQQFPVQTKAAPLEEIRHLVNRALPGLPLHALPTVPRQIPYHANHLYFAIDHSHSLWQKLEKSAGMAFHISGEFTGLQLALWAVKDKSHDK